MTKTDLSPIPPKGSPASEAGLSSSLQAAIAALAGPAACALRKRSETKVLSGSGIRPLIEALQSDPECMRGASVADRVVGKAAALIFIYGGAAEVYGEVVSAPAAEALTRANILLAYGKIVGRIASRDGKGLCPMEEAVLAVSSPAEAFRILSDKISKK